MNLIEAVKSGRRFRRIGQTNWYGNGVLRVLDFSRVDILAEDWETIRENERRDGLRNIDREQKRKLEFEELAMEWELNEQLQSERKIK